MASLIIDNLTSLLVPMRLSAYANYGSNRAYKYNNDSARAAYLAAIPSIDREGLNISDVFKSNQHTNKLAHDIYDHLREAPYAADADPSRTAPEREGIYLHWEVPKFYKTGHATSGADPTPQFRPVPDRYIILRSVYGPEGTHDICGRWSARDARSAAGIPSDNQLPGQTISVFVVDASRVRSDTEVGQDEDVEVTSSPYIDIDPTPGNTKPAYLGTTTSLYRWKKPADNVKRAHPLTVIRTGNPLFSDFQPHNSSVFSIFDPLTSSKGDIYLRGGTLSYTVVGWHTRREDDPLKTTYGPNLDQALKALGLELNDSYILPSYRDNISKMFTLCHGSLHNIRWNSLDVTIKRPADAIQASFASGHPFAVGSNSIDALFGWLRANQQTESKTSDFRAQLRKLQTWVMDTNDNVDAQLQADDLLSSNNFAPSAAGEIWHFDVSDSNDGSKTALPTPNDLSVLLDLNRKQRQINAIARETKALRQQLFDIWWTFVNDPNNASVEGVQKPTKIIVNGIQKRLKDLEALRVNLEKDKMPQVTVPLRSAPAPAFYDQRDPTLFIAGACSQWPNRAEPTTKVRLDGQDSLVSWIDNFKNPAWWWRKPDQMPSDYPLQQLNKNLSSGDGASIIDPDNQPALLRLLAEGASNANSSVSSSPVPPAYFGIEDRVDDWNGWYPLFVEWEVEYYDIPFQYWEFKPCGPESRWAYAIKDGIDISKVGLQNSYRVLSGRSPIVPSTSATLKSTLEQVFAKMNPTELESIVASDKRQELLTQAGGLDYLSTNMSGLTDQLLLRHQGTHVLPFTHGNSTTSASPQVLPEALAAGQNIGLVEADFQAMTEVSGTIPMTLHKPLASDDKVSPFKACTHGQFRFTKMSIVDRWGQVVQGVKTEYKQPFVQGIHSYPTALFPALGELYSVQSLTNGIANTVVPRKDKNCTFVQIPPCINQPARVNCDFVTPSSAATGQKTSWRALEQHEDPVRGYIVFNSANTSLQLFNGSGYFMCERLVLSGTVATRPFPEKVMLHSTEDPFLQGFLDQMKKPDFVSSLYHSISVTIANVQARPGHAAETMQAIMGRPLALVAFGTSLELAQPPKQSTTQFSQYAVAPSAEASIDQMSFSLKIGDRDNVFDGTYGVFKTDATTRAVDFSHFYAYDDTDPSKNIAPIQVKPFWVDPANQDGTDYAVIRAAKYEVFAALVDPYTPVHVYSALLPIKQLSLPHWAIERGLSAISSFFKMGPVVTVRDPPAPDKDKFVPRTNPPTTAAKLPAEIGKIQVPALGLADWAWMQPTQVQGGDTEYNVLGIEAQPSGPVYEEGPHTVVEGFLQMRKPFGAPDPVK